ncbi:MAG TPA: protein kinase [Gemmataceae bacterium]|jgi:serine/threonine protein kinase|nr:protein kinase [Gemmataceae bacterium]
MPAPTTVEELLKLIRKSGMIEEPRLDAYLERLRLIGPIPADVRKLAGSMVKDSLLTYFQAEQFMLGKWRGFTIGKYKLLERIGFGGMGQVFLCEHMYMRRRVAIKVLPPAKAEEPAALGRFYREARAAAALDHPNIVRTHDIDQDGNLHFLVMEYVDGSSLLEIVKKKGPMSIDRAVYAIWQSVQGLDHAFRVGVIHRDIKPGNILIDRDGIAKILDMGLARFYASDDDMLTKKYDEKSVLGTADYVAPEQTINSHEVDVRADIYSLGATFYFLLAGHPPFPEGSISQKLIAHQTRNPTPIRNLRPEVPQPIADIVAKMMAKSIDHRFQSPTEVYDALLPYVDQSCGVPPEDEMPVLSPAARDPAAVGAGGGSPSGSGSFRQDSAILRAEILQRSGRMSTPGTGPRASSGAYQRPPVATLPVPPSRAGDYLGSEVMGPGSFGPPAVSPLGSAAMPPVPNPTRPGNETARMAESTERASQPAWPTRTIADRYHPSAGPDNGPRGLFGRPMSRIVLECLLLFLLCLGAVVSLKYLMS